MSKINVTLGFDADTSQAQRRINELATSLRQLSAHPVELLDDTDFNGTRCTITYENSEITSSGELSKDQQTAILN